MKSVPAGIHTYLWLTAGCQDSIISTNQREERFGKISPPPFQFEKDEDT